eukprot:1158122-Pelagomonas_calceolata.AAC.18
MACLVASYLPEHFLQMRLTCTKRKGPIGKRCTLSQLDSRASQCPCKAATEARACKKGGKGAGEGLGQA